MIDKKMQNYYTKEEKILISQVVDQYYHYLKTGMSTSSSFLNPIELKLVTSYLKSQKIPYFIYDIYSFLEKKIIYFGEYQDFITIYKGYTDIMVTHPQILKSLFSIGFKQNTIGDIFVEDNYFYITNLTKMNEFLENNLLEIGGQVVTLEQVSEIILTKNHFATSNILVSSMRIDNVISKLVPCSRVKAMEMLKNGYVFLNYQEYNHSFYLVKENDILSIRKVGKYKIGKTLGYSKKNNIILEIIRYL